VREIATERQRETERERARDREGVYPLVLPTGPYRALIEP
jgi:hypothetical protein